MENNNVLKVKEVESGDYVLVPSVDPENTGELKSTTEFNAHRLDYGPTEKRRILKNLIGIGLVFVMMFTAFQSTANLQSSLHAKGGLGPYSLASIYVGIVISSLFLPSLMMKKLKCKAAILWSISGYAVYIAAQFYPTFGTLIPAGLFLGFCAAPLWAAHSTFISQIAEEFAHLTATASDTVLQRFFGIFFFVFQSSHIFGNLMLSFILRSGDTGASQNLTRSVGHCGVNFCPAGSSVAAIADVDIAAPVSFINETFGVEGIDADHAAGPDMTKTYTLIGIYLGCTVLSAVLLAVIIDPLSRYGENERKSNEREPNAKDLLLATFKHLAKPHQLLLIPLSLWYGISLGFFGVDFTSGYISCAWGVEYIGFVMMCYGVAAGISSFALGSIIKFTGRAPVFILAASINVGGSILMLQWEPNTAQPWFFFLVAGLWGVTDGVYSPQISALYGSIFPDTKAAGFSNIRLWQSIGFVIAYVNGTKFCMGSKLYFGLVMTVLSLAGYLAVEFHIRSRAKRAARTKS